MLPGPGGINLFVEGKGRVGGGEGKAVPTLRRISSCPRLLPIISALEKKTTRM